MTEDKEKPTNTDIKEKQKEKMQQLNRIEEIMQPVRFEEDPKDSIEYQIAQMEKEKIDLASKFLSGDMHERTEITKSERKLLPLLTMMAKNPFEIKEKIKGEHDNEFLLNYIELYLKMGIPLSRKGRKEEVQILQGLFAQPQEIEGKEEKKPIWRR